jgi:O-antigen/teichoic acid export membrane protein
MKRGGGAELTDPGRPELLSRVLSGFSWVMASQVLSQILSTASLVLLARILAPRQFGIAAMAQIATAFVITYSDFGLGLALVQKETITDVDRSTVFWASIALGAIMSGVCVAAAPFVARFYHTPEVEPLLDVLAISFLFTGLGSTHRSLQFRAMNYRALEIRSMVAVLLGTLVTITVALAGGGAWAIILGAVTSAAASTILLIAMGGWMPHLIFSWQSLRELGAYGLRYVGGMTFLTLNQNADNILVGRALGQAALGTYNLAYSVILVPISRVASPACQLMAPAFARLQSDKPALTTNWLRGTRLLLMVFFPLMLTVAVTAPDIVHIVFGAKWDGAIPVIRILAAVCALLSIQGLADSLMQAIGAMRPYLRMKALSFAVNITAFFIGIQWGLVGMAVAFGISTLLFMLLYLVVVARSLASPSWCFVPALTGVTVAAAALVIVEAGVYALLGPTHIGPVLQTGITALCGVATFALVCLWLERGALLELIRFAAKAVPIPRRLRPQVLQSA